MRTLLPVKVAHDATIALFFAQRMLTTKGSLESDRADLGQLQNRVVPCS
jgi:hypothetical protein